MHTSPYTWKTPDGIPIQAASWEPEAGARGLVCLVHGLGEHGGRYLHVAERLTRSGYTVFAADLRGHGKSGGPRGHTPSFERLQEDLVESVRRARREFADIPAFLYGHSLGGVLVLEAVLKRRLQVAGVIATSPMLRLPFDPPGWKVAIGRVTNVCLPAFAQASGLETAALSRDPQIEASYIQDPLVHDRITSRTFFGVIDAGEWILAHASELAVPLLLMHGTADRLTSMEASCQFAARAGKQCTLFTCEGGYHELHNDLEKVSCLERIVSWLDSQL
jgi:alpha-beta hydrolase superfamily lysophospholipase